MHGEIAHILDKKDTMDTLLGKLTFEKLQAKIDAVRLAKAESTDKKAWEELLNKFGSELRQTPATLRIMFINILPKEMGEKLRPKRAKYPAFLTLMAHVRASSCRKETIRDRSCSWPGSSQ